MKNEKKNFGLKNDKKLRENGLSLDKELEKIVQKWLKNRVNYLIFSWSFTTLFFLL